MMARPWRDYIVSFWDWDHYLDPSLPGFDLGEWIDIIQQDYDEVDRFYIDHEVIGGD